MSRFILSLVFGFSLVSSSAQEKSAYPDGVEVREYTGWHNSIFLDSGDVEAVIVPGAAGRVMRYALNYENIIFERPETAGRVLTNPDDQWSFGGYQVDLGPELRGIPRHDELWRGVYSWHIPGPFTARVTSKPDPSTGIELTKEFVMDPDNGDLGLLQIMKNISSTNLSYCLWDRTLCKGGGFAIVPLNSRSRFKNKWAKRVGERSEDWAYDGTVSTPRELEVRSGHAIIQCQGPASKFGFDTTEGWIAYARGKLLFVKYFPYFPGGNYSDGGCSAQVYFNETFAELEPLSPEVSLEPGASYTFPEKWVLIELDRPVNTHRDASRIIDRIPPSPFPKN